ncbi:MAG: 23S rRNA (uracil(1939)-C(5))-methyltransferase RlmD [Synergistaceae bacterium]|nr:23S rRNA (uracil(1939)-C(5))-methyltransferase RlmD [Synergistaceae bacterium]
MWKEMWKAGRTQEAGKTIATVDLAVEKMSSDGSGIARTKEGIVFIKGALPGEVVEAEVTKRKKDFSLARVVRVKERNPRRVQPACPVSGTCGGCQLQHASYELQLEIKADTVRDAMTRLGGFDLRDVFPHSEPQCVPSPRQWGYRNKASFPVRRIKGKPVAGFYEEGSHRLVPLETCPVNAAPLNKLFGMLQKELPRLALSVYDERQTEPSSFPPGGALRHLILRAGLRTGQTLVSLVVAGRLNARSMKSIAGLCRPLKDVTTLTLNHNSRPGNVVLGDRTEAIKGSGLIGERLDEWTLAYDTSSFFQVNADQAVQLYRYVRALAQNGALPQEDRGLRVLELYSGVGSLTCYLAETGSVTAVEEWGRAAELMERNLKDNGISNVGVLQGRAEDVLENLPGGYGLVVLDPPRSGCQRVVLDKILEFGPRRVLYVSCNPSTLARDAKILREGGYRLKSLRAFDMFPQTTHVETVALMESGSAESNFTGR